MCEMENVQRYSVLMSVYAKEKPAFLKASLESVFCQTAPTDDFVLVCDGPLGEELDCIVKQTCEEHADVLKVIRLPRNVGLGNALNEGLKYCKHNLVARMDSDDVSVAERCEMQLRVFEEHPEISVVSGTVLEFQTSPEEITGRREVPELHEEICAFSKKRNPFNHPAVMFRKAAVEAVGGYSEAYPLFEDYYLWIRMLQNGAIGYNLKESVLYMRTPADLYMRRGGKVYCRNMLRFHKWLLKTKWSGKSDYLFGAVPHALICRLPNGIRKKIYEILHK